MAAFSKEQNRGNANIRNRSIEFAKCSLFLKEFKIGARSYLSLLKGDKIHVRLMQLFMELKKLDAVSRPGSLSVYNGLRTEKGKNLLRNFVFNKESRLSTQLGYAALDFENFVVTWKSVDPKFIKFPPLGTHIDLSVLLLCYDPIKEIFTGYEGTTYRFGKDDEPMDITVSIEEPVERRDDFLYIFLGGMKFVEIFHDAEYDCEGRGGFGMEFLG